MNEADMPEPTEEELEMEAEESPFTFPNHPIPMGLFGEAETAERTARFIDLVCYATITLAVLAVVGALIYGP